jgi:hypothetical protein
MTQRLFLAVLTAGVFLAGYGTRMLTDRGQPIPPPPAVLTSEYVTAPGADKDTLAADRAKERAKLVAEIEKFRPQIEAYRAQVEEIYAEFDREFVQVLNEAQRDKYATNQKKWTEREAKRKANAAANPTPLSDDDINHQRQQALTDVYWMVTVTRRLEHLTKEYQLDPAQQASVRALLTLRRTKFLALLDATPHVSVHLNKLAPMLKQLELQPK